VQEFVLYVLGDMHGALSVCILEDACVSIRLMASKTKGAPRSSQASREGG
jgi:hypothetical protein